MQNGTPARALLRPVAPVLAVGVSVGLVAVMPGLLGLTWAAVLDVLTGLSVLTLVGLGALWLAGLLVHTVVLTAALPGLSHRRALLLNLSGSAVSNLLPFGGAAGMGLGFAMARTWQVPPAAFASFTAISNLWNVLGKLLVGSTILGVALVLGVALPASLHPAVVLAAVGSLLGVVALAVVMVCSARVSRVVGVAVDRLLAPLARRTGRRVDVAASLAALRDSSREAVGRGWARLTLGVLGYLALQAVLLAACLVATGAHAPLLVVAVAFGIDRLISTLPFTPGGAGLAELGAVAALVALGVDPVAAGAGTLLYRLFTFLLEIPVGGASALVWVGHHRVVARRATA